MEKGKELCVWLQHWKLSQQSAIQPAPWQLLPKGTPIYFLSATWLDQLWTLVSQLPSLESLVQVTQIPLNNADIRSPYSYSDLREGATPMIDYAVVPASVFDHIFASWLRDSDELLQGYVVWDGAFTPKLISVPYILPCLVEANREFYRSEVKLTANCSVEDAKSQALQRASIGSDDEVRLWHSTRSTTQTALSESLSTHPDLSSVDWMSPLRNADQGIFQALNSQVLFIEIQKKRSWWSELKNPFLTKSKSVGLENIGNSCYMNAVLQCLVHCYEFALLHVLAPGLPAYPQVLAEVKCLIQAQLVDPEAAYTPRGLYEAVQGCFGALTRQQEDAQQFLARLLDLLSPASPSADLALMSLFEGGKMQDEAAWLRYWTSVPTLQRDIMSGLQKNYMICGLCGNSSVKYAPFQTFFLSLPAAKRYKITVVHCDLQKSPTQLTIESTTPLESNESVHNIWRQVASEVGISSFIIGELKHKLFVPLGLTNIAVLSAYMVMELPPFDPAICLIMVDIYSRLGQERAGDVAVATRVVSVPAISAQDQLLTVVIAALVDIYSAYCQRKLTQKWLLSSEEALQVLSNRSQLSLTSLDWTDSGLTPRDWVTDTGTCPVTLGELCAKCDTKMPRFALIVVNLPEDLAESLEENYLRRTITFQNFFEGNPEKDLNVTLPQMIEYSLNEKPLNEEDLLQCEACGRKAQHIEGLQVCVFPRVLVCALQRARLHPSGLRKSEVWVHYPLKDLDLSMYEKGAAEDAPLYDLIGVIHHQGSLLKGHYKAHALHPLTHHWYLYDDADVTEIDKETDVLDPKDTYLLFYSRKYAASRPSFRTND